MVVAEVHIWGIRTISCRTSSEELKLLGEDVSLKLSTDDIRRGTRKEKSSAETPDRPVPKLQRPQNWAECQTRPMDLDNLCRLVSDTESVKMQSENADDDPRVQSEYVRSDFHASDGYSSPGEGATHSVSIANYPHHFELVGVDREGGGEVMLVLLRRGVARNVPLSVSRVSSCHEQAAVSHLVLRSAGAAAQAELGFSACNRAGQESSCTAQLPGAVAC